MLSGMALEEGGYVKAGKYEPLLGSHTNLIENTIRPITPGRNNYRFAGSHDVAQYAAIIYSQLATCIPHEVNAYD